MTQKEIFAKLQSTEIPFRYYKWAEAPPVPFGVYYFPASANFAADGIVYKEKNSLTVEVYNDKKDFAIECKIERMFRENGWVWEKTETYIESEKLYMVNYETEVFIDERKKQS